MGNAERFNECLDQISEEIRKTHSEYGLQISCVENVEQVNEFQLAELQDAAGSIIREAVSRLLSLDPNVDLHVEFVPVGCDGILIVFDHCQGKSTKSATANLGCSSRID